MGWRGTEGWLFVTDYSDDCEMSRVQDVDPEQRGRLSTVFREGTQASEVTDSRHWYKESVRVAPTLARRTSDWGKTPSGAPASLPPHHPGARRPRLQDARGRRPRPATPAPTRQVPLIKLRDVFKSPPRRTHFSPLLPPFSQIIFSSQMLDSIKQYNTHLRSHIF